MPKLAEGEEKKKEDCPRASVKGVFWVSKHNQAPGANKVPYRAPRSIQEFKPGKI